MLKWWPSFMFQLFKSKLRRTQSLRQNRETHFSKPSEAFSLVPDSIVTHRGLLRKVVEECEHSSSFTQQLHKRHAALLQIDGAHRMGQKVLDIYTTAHMNDSSRFRNPFPASESIWFAFICATDGKRTNFIWYSQGNSCQAFIYLFIYKHSVGQLTAPEVHWSLVLLKTVTLGGSHVHIHHFSLIS